MVSQLRFDFTGVTSEEGEEALCAGVDDVDLVEGDGVGDFLALLEFAFGALDESGLRSRVSVQSQAARKGGRRSHRHP